MRRRPCFLRTLVAAGVVPGPVYRLDEVGNIWSALGAYLEGEAAPRIKFHLAWYTPAAAYWVRAAKLDREIAVADISKQYKKDFAEDYAYAIVNLNADLKPYGEQIENAEQSWDAWIRGAYAVCMRSFSADAVVEKLVRRMRAREFLGLGVQNLTSMERKVFLRDLSRLSTLLTPFSPFERPTGTPGTLIDKGLEALGLGTENPFSIAVQAPLREAC